jgi:RNA polymerase sigma factor (sigma-70 family)
LAIRSLNDFGLRQANADEEVDIQRADRNRAGAPNDDENRLQFYQPDEGYAGEAGIPDQRLSTPEQIAYSDEMISFVQFALGRANSEDREAFILYAIEGFSLKEIATIVDRPPEQVRQSVHRAREALRRNLPVENRLKDKLLQHTGTH